MKKIAVEVTRAFIERAKANDAAAQRMIDELDTELHDKIPFTYVFLALPTPTRYIKNQTKTVRNNS